MNPDEVDELNERMAAVLEMQARCTCTPESDIRDCPNYEPGDEEAFE